MKLLLSLFLLILTGACAHGGGYGNSGNAFADGLRNFGNEMRYNAQQQMNNRPRQCISNTMAGGYTFTNCY